MPKETIATMMAPERPRNRRLSHLTNWKGLHSLVLCMFSLSLMLAACQTTTPDSQESKTAAAMDSQKAVIRNALDNGKPDLALQNLRTLLRQFPDDAGLQNLMGLTQLALKNNGRAVKHFEIAYKLDKQVATALNLSSALIENGDHDHAERLLTGLIKQAEKTNYPYKERLYHNLGYLSWRDKKPLKAEQWYAQAIEENPTFFPSHLELARVYERTRRPALASKSYRRAIDYCTVCFEPVQELSELMLKGGKSTEARLLLAKFAKTENVNDIDRGKAERMLSRLRVASVPTGVTGG